MSDPCPYCDLSVGWVCEACNADRTSRHLAELIALFDTEIVLIVSQVHGSGIPVKRTVKISDIPEFAELVARIRAEQEQA